MKAVAVLLSVLFVLLQIRLWFGDGSVSQVFKLKEAVAEQKAIVEDLSKRNQRQDAEVQDLKLRMGALEERARNDLGMIQKGETFYQYDARITEAELKRANQTKQETVVENHSAQAPQTQQTSQAQQVSQVQKTPTESVAAPITEDEQVKD